MVSEITTVRLWSQQTALKAFKEYAGQDGGAASASSQSAFGGIRFASNRDDGADDDNSLARLIASLQAQASGASGSDDTAQDGAVEDIGSKAFMKALATKLEELKASSATGPMTKAMLAALDAGTLTVLNATAGEAITAWNPSSKDAAVAEKTVIERSDWTSFLKEHLARDANGLYQRNADSSHRDKISGASAYFGMIGDSYYYLSWPADAAAAPSPVAASQATSG